MEPKTPSGFPHKRKRDEDCLDFTYVPAAGLMSGSLNETSYDAFSALPADDGLLFPAHDGASVNGISGNLGRSSLSSSLDFSSINENPDWLKRDPTLRHANAGISTVGMPNEAIHQAVLASTPLPNLPVPHGSLMGFSLPEQPLQALPISLQQQEAVPLEHNEDRDDDEQEQDHHHHHHAQQMAQFQQQLHEQLQLQQQALLDQPMQDSSGEFVPPLTYPPCNAQLMTDDFEEDESSKGMQITQLSPLEKLTTNQYLWLLKQMDAKLRKIRGKITDLHQMLYEQQQSIDHELPGLENQLAALRAQLELFLEEFEGLKSAHYLRAGDFNNLLSLEEFLTSTLIPQLSLYEVDYQQLAHPQLDGQPQELTACLAIVGQENAGPIFKEKAIGPFTLRVLTGATFSHIQSGPVQPELVETSQRIKRNNQDLENAKQIFKENGFATFSDLKFSSGTFPNLVRLKFRVTITIVVNGQKISKTIESAPTKPFISMTNTGSQWKDAAGAWLKEDCFKDNYEITVQRLWNYFQKHYLISTKQELNNIKRPILLKDFEYMLYAKFKQGLEKQTINQKEFLKFWDWIGVSLKKIRYQKYLLWLFENGYLPAFMTGLEAEEQLKNETPGTFLIRLSERLDGEFVISYAHQSGVRHYLIQPDDTADKKKTLIDFLGQNPLFSFILQVTLQPSGKKVFYKHSKDKVLQRYYKKAPKQTKHPTNTGNNPYDTRLPDTSFG